jgi:hypothetical protein
MNQRILERETIAYRGSGSVGTENRCMGFRPAFRDTETGRVYPFRFADGCPALFHLSDGVLPDEVAVAPNVAGGVTRVKDTVVSGFT